MSGKKANIHSSLRASDTSQCRKAPWCCLIGFLVILFLSEGPVWQSWGRAELPESLLELRTASDYSQPGASYQGGPRI